LRTLTLHMKGATTLPLCGFGVRYPTRVMPPHSSISAACTPQNYAEALKWFRLAAAQGSAGAQFFLGNMYLSGQGVPESYAEAVKWYRLAADQGNATAQVFLGNMYAYGQGVSQDYVRAHMWFNLSAAHGGQLAAEARDNIARRMTPAQIAESQKLAREWRPAP
jgi:uncharacterized protein